MSSPPDSTAARTPRRPRLRGRVWLLIFCGLGLFFSLLPAAPQHAALRRILTGVLTRQTEREVRIGAIRGVLWFGAVVEGVSISEPGGFGDDGQAVMFSVGRVAVRYSLLRLLLRRDPAGAIARIDVLDPQGKITRTADGIDLVELFRPDEKPDRPNTFAARLTVRGGTLHLFDRVVSPPDRPGRPWHHRIEHELTDLQFAGEDPIRLLRAELTLTAADGPPLAERLSVRQVTIAPDPLAVDGRLAVTGLDLGRLQAYLEPYAGERLTLLGGAADLDGTLRLTMPPKPATEPPPGTPAPRPDVAVEFAATLRDVSLTEPRLGRPLRAVSGGARVELSLAGDGRPAGRIALEELSLEAGGSRLELAGVIDQLDDPRLDVNVRAPRLRLGELAGLLPSVPQLADLRGDGTSRAEVRLRGTAATLRVDGWVEPREVAWGDLGRVADGRARLQLQRNAAAPYGVEGRAVFEGLDASSPRLNEPVRDLRGELQLIGRRAVLRDLRAGLGAADLRADGFIDDVGGPAMRLALTVKVDGLSPLAVAPALPAAYRPVAARGTLAADLLLRGPPRALAVRGTVRAPWVRWPQATHLGGAYTLDVQLGAAPRGTVRLADAGFEAPRLCAAVTQAGGVLELAGDQVRLRGLRAVYGGGRVRVDGRVALDASRLDLDVAADGVPLEAVTCAVGNPRVRGRGPLRCDLRVRGTRRRLEVVGDVRVPRLTVPGARLGHADLRCDLVVYPARGAAGLIGAVDLRSAALTADAAPVPLTALAGRLVFAGPNLAIGGLRGRANGDPFSVRGNVAGLPNLSSVDLRVATARLRQETLRRAAPTNEALRQFVLALPATADLRVRGPLDRLAIQGEVLAPSVTVGPEREIIAGGRAELRLVLLRGGRLPLEGTVTLTEGRLRHRVWDLPVEQLHGRLRFYPTGRVVVVEGSEIDALRGELGAERTPFRLRGEITVAEAVGLDLQVDVERLSIADLRAATSGLENPPTVEGEGALRLAGVRLTGTTERLRVTTGEGASAGWIGLPERLSAMGYEVAGGRARADLTIAGGTLETARLDLIETSLTVGATGTRLTQLNGNLQLAASRLTGTLDARVGGRPIYVEPHEGPVGPPGGPPRVELRVRAREVPFAELLPKLANLRETVLADRVSSDLIVSGPLDDLTVAGQALVAGGPSGVQPLRAELALRLVRATPDAEPELFGGVRLAGGGLPLANLDRPLDAVTGSVAVSTRSVTLHDLSARLGGGRVVLNGTVDGLPEPRFDLVAEVDQFDAGGLLEGLRVENPKQPAGPKVGFYEARGWPALRTPEPVSGTLRLRGPRESVAVDVALSVPLVTVDPRSAMVEDRGLGAGDPLFERRGGVLLADSRLVGQAVGSLVPPEPAGVEEPSLLESFRLALRFESSGVNARQVVSFLSEKARAETPATLYAHQPGRLELSVLGRATNPELVGRLDLPRIEYYGVPFRRVALNFGLFEQIVTFTDGLLDVRGGTLRSHGAMAVAAGAPLDLVAAVEVDGVEMAVLNAMRLPALADREVDGVLDGALRLHLSEEIPRVQGALMVHGLSVDGASLGTGAVEFGFEDKLLQVRRATLVDEARNASVELRGRVALDGRSALDLAADIRNLDLGAVAPFIPGLGPEGLSGRLDFGGRLAGSARLPLLVGTANVRFGSVAGYPFGRLTLNAVEAGADGLLARVELSDPAYQAAATARLEGIDPTTGAARLSLEVDELALDLSRALPLVGDSALLADSSGTVRGTASLTARLPERPEVAEGEAPPADERPSLLSTLRGEVNLSAGDPTQPRRLQVAGRRLDAATLRCAVGDNALEIRELEVLAGQTRLGIDPARPSRIDDLAGQRVAQLYLTSDAIYYDDLVGFTRLPLRTEGFVTLAAEVNGPLAEPLADVTLATHGLSINGEALDDRQVRARVGRGWATVEGQQRVELFGCRLTVDGGTFEQTTRLNAELAVTDFERLSRFLDSISRPAGDQLAARWQVGLQRLVRRLPHPLTGELAGRLSLSGSVDRPLGELSVRLAGATAREPAVPVPDVRVEVAIGRPTPPDAEAVGPETVQIVGNVDLRRDTVTGRRDGLLRLALASGPVDLARYAGWSDSLAGVAGRLQLGGTVTGTLAEPRVELREAAVDGLTWSVLALDRLELANLVYTRDALELDALRLHGGGLTGELTGYLPLGGTPKPEAAGLAAWAGRIRPGEPLEARLTVSLERRGELMRLGDAGLAAEGTALVDLRLAGTADQPLLNGSLQADFPQLVALDLEEATEAEPPPPTPEPDGPPAAEPAWVPIPDGARPVVRLADCGLDLRVEDNLVRVGLCRTAVLTGDGRPAGTIGLVPDGTVLLRYLSADRLLENPIDLALEARDVRYRSRDLRLEDLDLVLGIDPAQALRDDPATRDWLARIRIEEAKAWLNGGLIAAEGTVGIRRPELSAWQDNAWQVRVATPTVDPNTVVPIGFSGEFRPTPQPRPDGLIYPVRLERGGIGAVKLAADVALRTREGQTPPLTLTGQVDLFDADLREGMLGLFAARRDPDAAPPSWPAAPRMDIVVNAERNNWIHARVPQIDLPLQARLRVTETPQQLRLDGTASLGEGAVSATVLKSQVRVRGGEARFAVRRNPGSGAFEPNVSLRAAATTVVRESGGGRSGSYEVDLDVRGTVRPGVQRPVDTEFQVNATSSPPLPEQQIFALLSRKEEFASAIEQGELQTFVQQELANAAIQAALGVALSPLLEEFREALGLDVLRLEYNVDGRVDIEAGQYLDPRQKLFLTFMVEVGGRRTPRQILKIDYDVGRGVSVGAQIDTLGDFRSVTEYRAEF